MSTTLKQAKEKNNIDLSGIAKLRKKKGLTQEELALMSGLKIRYLSKIENSKVNPRIGDIIKITKALGIDLKLSSKSWLSEETIK